jgi:hypothetical protein
MPILNLFILVKSSLKLTIMFLSCSRKKRMTRWNIHGKLAGGDAAHHDGDHAAAGRALLLRFASPCPLMGASLTAPYPGQCPACTEGPRPERSFQASSGCDNLDKCLTLSYRLTNLSLVVFYTQCVHVLIYWMWCLAKVVRAERTT